MGRLLCRTESRYHSPSTHLTMSDLTLRWNETASTLLKGRTITDVFYMTEEEAEDLGWQSRALVLVLDDGSQLIAQSDDEGNDAGALSWANATRMQTLPVL